MQAEIVIVGAGPAGCATALSLCQLDPALAGRTLVLERARHPRPKLCAGGCVADVDNCLRRLGLDLSNQPHVPVSTMQFLYGDRGFAFQPDPVSLRVVRRAQFDAWLADAVRGRGIALREQTRVEGISRDLGSPHGPLTVHTDAGPIRARVVVGADGSGGVVRRMLRSDPAAGAQHADGDAHRTARLVEVVKPESPTDVVAADAATGRRTDRRTAEFQFARPDGRTSHGYAWTFPTADGDVAMRNFGIYDSAIRATARRSDSDALDGSGSLRPPLEEYLATFGATLQPRELRGHPLRWYLPGAPLSTDGVILVGDAAGADALCGEGIGPALGYGELAAHAIRDAFVRGDFSFAGYGAWVARSPLGQSLRRRTRLARWAYGRHGAQIQPAVFWHLGRLAAWYMGHFVLGWSARPLPDGGPAPQTIDR